jgi:hypothetical protein
LKNYKRRRKKKDSRLKNTCPIAKPGQEILAKLVWHLRRQNTSVKGISKILNDDKEGEEPSVSVGFFELIFADSENDREYRLNAILIT